MEEPLPFSSLRLLVPPLRLMSAAMWSVVRSRDVAHYGKVEEFVSLVAEALPDLLTGRKTRLLTLGLRAKVALQMLSCGESDDLRSVQTRVNSLLPSSPNQFHQEHEALESNFVRLLQRLSEDPKEREYFLQTVIPVEFGPDFDAALEILVCEFFTRLEELLLIPDFKQAAVWMTDTSSMLDEYMQCVAEADDLRALLRSKAHRGGMTEMFPDDPSSSEQRLFSSLSLLPSLHETIAGDAESDTQMFENQRESEGISPQELRDTGIRDARWPFEAETTNTEPTPGGKCSNSFPDVQIVEEYDDLVSASCRAPSTPTECPVLSRAVIGPPRRRVAHKCAQCGKCFIYRYELLEHERLHTGENPYKCTECGKAYRRSSDLSTHRRTHCVKAAYICIKCDNSFQSIQDKFRHKCGFKKMQQPSTHEPTHTQNAIFECGQRGEVYPSTSELRSHPDVHPPLMSDRCFQRGKSFSSVACSTAHELRRGRRTAHVCERCGKAFERKRDLTLHRRSHTGGEAVAVHVLRETLLGVRKPEQTHEDPRWRETVSVL